jgi:glutamate/tyrosine decarboxylase-like PLP-dependent enzyme
MTNFDFDPQERLELYNHVIKKIDNFYNNTNSYDVSPKLEFEKIQAYIRQSDFNTPKNAKEAINNIINGLEKFTVHTPHPKYFGLFNPRANFSGILADLITATFNPQLAAWSHAPFAVEVESHLIAEFGKKFGYNEAKIDGVFTTGGAESNLTALLCALNNFYTDFAQNGLIGLNNRPMIYCSTEAHHSINKASKTTGLGYSSIQRIPVDANLKMDQEYLISTLQQDIKNGNRPLMIIGTAGATGSGAIDDLVALSEIADKYNIWFHVDAAYGGGAVLNKHLISHLKGVELSDSITFDAHKWMSVPMGTSIFLTSHKEILGKTFRISTEYMPKEANELDIVEPFTHSIQWSRRFAGLKLFLSLQIFGWQGYDEVVGHQAKMGDLLKQKLVENNWSIKNNSPFPVICFTDNSLLHDDNFSKIVSQKIIASGKSWISVYPIKGISTLRACITNYNTNEKELDELIMELNYQREIY